jgi:hypothetical protein
MHGSNHFPQYDLSAFHIDETLRALLAGYVVCWNEAKHHKARTSWGERG